MKSKLTEPVTIDIPISELYVEAVFNLLGKYTIDFMEYVRRREKEFARLEYHESTTVGLWAIDRDPREVSYEWIVENAYRITSPDNAPERVC